MCPNLPGVTGLYLEKIIILPVGGFPRVCEFSKGVAPPSLSARIPPHKVSVSCSLDTLEYLAGIFVTRYEFILIRGAF